jgi:hypothetical protein
MHWTLSFVHENLNEWVVALPIFPNNWQCLLLLCDASANQSQSRWGMGWVLASVDGCVLARGHCGFDAVFCSTTLVEVTAIAQAMCDVRRALHDQGRDDVSIWPWCDNKSAVQLIRDRKLLDMPYGFMGRALTHLSLMYEMKPFVPGWCPAQHDTNDVGLLSMLNKLADEEARCGVVEEDCWQCPSVWVDGPSVLVRNSKGALIVDMKKAIKDHFHWLHVPKKQESTENMCPFSFWGSLPLCTEVEGMWLTAVPLHPITSAMVSLGAQYHDVKDLFLSDEYSTKCDVCSRICQPLALHKVRDCFKVFIRLLDAMAGVFSLCLESLRNGVSIYREWFGFRLQCCGQTVFLQVSHPSFVASGLAEGLDNVGWMPVFMGCHLSAECARRLRDILRIPLKMFMVRFYDCLCQVVVHANEVKSADRVRFWNLRSGEPLMSALKADCRLLRVFSPNSLSIPFSLAEGLCIVFGAISKVSCQPKCPWVDRPAPKDFPLASCDSTFHLDHWIGFCARHVDACSRVVERCRLLQPHLVVLVFPGFIGVDIWNIVKRRGFSPRHVEIKDFRCSLAVWVNRLGPCGGVYAEWCSRLHEFLLHVNGQFA